jgi:hypothetical protein
MDQKPFYKLCMKYYKRGNVTKFNIIDIKYKVDGIC